MRSRWNMPIYVAYVALCITALGFIVLQMGITLPWSHPYSLTATFRNGAGILTGNEVLMNGSKIGRIEDVKAVNGQAQVNMIVEASSGLPIYRNAQAQVRIKNLLGETYVEVNRGSTDSGQLPDGGHIPVDHTITPVQIDEVLAILDPNSRQRLQLLLNGAGDSLANNGQNLNDQAGIVKDLLTSLNGPAAELAARRSQLNDIVLELQRFYDVLAQQRIQVRDEFAVWNQVMAQQANQEQAIIGTIKQADQFLQAVSTLVTGESSNIQATLTSLPGTLNSFNGFLDKSNVILSSLSQVKQGVHDIFPHLSTSFADTDSHAADPNSPTDPSKHQHLWTVFGINCNTTCSGSYAPSQPNATWAAVVGGTTP
jgi:phospholipid/cholesterol/gamma-HCH transport system substrate-binding protein